MKKLWIPTTKDTIFTLEDAFSFGTDAILLSDFAKVKKHTVVADVGAGTGIIGFRMLKLYHLKKIYLIEIQKENCALMERTQSYNHFDNVEICHTDFRTAKMERESLDAVVSNPPYRKVQSGPLCKTEHERISRTEITFPLDALFTFAKKVLKDRGSLFVVHRADRLVDLLEYARKEKLEPKKMRMVKSFEGEKPKLVLLQCVKNANRELILEKDLVIYKNGSYTDEVLRIYGDYK